jgi:hypothetical protein
VGGIAAGEAKVEGDVQISAVVDGGETTAILGEERPRNPLLADVGGVPDDEVELARKRGQEEVVPDEPGVAEGVGIMLVRSPVQETAEDALAGGGAGGGMDLHRPDRGGEPGGLGRADAVDRSRDEQPVHHRQQEAAVAEGRFEQPKLVQGAGWRVLGEVQDRRHDLVTRKNRTALGLALPGEREDRFADRQGAKGGRGGIEEIHGTANGWGSMRREAVYPGAEPESDRL